MCVCSDAVEHSFSLLTIAAVDQDQGGGETSVGGAAGCGQGQGGEHEWRGGTASGSVEKARCRE